ncbi:hypothetical protein M8994_08440 [Brucella sp. 21LCYQ03]|nr:hypothetical protein [Brucella sp. 21LCYQ03]
MMKKFIVSSNSELYIHGTIGNAAIFLKNRIKMREEAKDREGIAFDYAACLLMISYWLEAEVNFFIHFSKESVEDNFWPRFKRLNDILGLQLEKDKFPWNDIDALRAFRNDFAHGKPKFNTIAQEEIIATDADIQTIANQLLTRKWEESVTNEFLNQSYSAAQWFIDTVGEKLEIGSWEGNSEGMLSVKYVGPAE